MTRTPAKYAFAVAVFLISEGSLVWHAFHVRGWMIPFAVFVAPYVGGAAALLAGGFLLLFRQENSSHRFENTAKSASFLRKKSGPGDARNATQPLANNRLSGSPS